MQYFLQNLLLQLARSSFVYFFGYFLEGKVKTNIFSFVTLQCILYNVHCTYTGVATKKGKQNYVCYREDRKKKDPDPA